ncbi:hypothetical protein AKJ16_DCAP19605, partial [Drosera capensis]
SQISPLSPQYLPNFSPFLVNQTFPYNHTTQVSLAAKRASDRNQRSNTLFTHLLLSSCALLSESNRVGSKPGGFEAGCNRVVVSIRAPCGSLRVELIGGESVWKWNDTCSTKCLNEGKE